MDLRQSWLLKAALFLKWGKKSLAPFHRDHLLYSLIGHFMSVALVGSELLVRESIFGLGVMFIAMICNIYIFAFVAIAYQKRLKKLKYLNKHLEIMRYAAFTMLLVVGMSFSLTVWVVALNLFEVVVDWQSATLLTFSFFTSVGNFTVDLPFGWRLIPSLIAFTGLFSFAGATAVAMGMAHQLMNQFDAHKTPH